MIQRYKPALAWFASILLATGVFVYILLDRSPYPVRPIAIQARLGFTIVLPLIFTLILLALRIEGFKGQVIAMCTITALFALSLAGLWASGYSDSVIISGLLPWSDADGFYDDARRLLEGWELTHISARRPLFSGLFAVLLGISHQNLQAALAGFALLNAFSCYLLGREIRCTHGALTAAFTLTLLFFFYRRFSGAVMTENLGLPLGVLGFALLWRGTALRDTWLILTSILVTTLALNTRAGAFFVLPALILWAGRMWRTKSLLHWKLVGLGCAAIACGFLLNAFVFHFTGASSQGVPFSNFSYTLYGLARGGERWNVIFDRYPELFNIPEPEHSRRIYKLAFDEIRHQPMNLAKGMLKQWQLLFSTTRYGAYSFVVGETLTPIRQAVNLTLFLLAFAGLFFCFQKRNASQYTSLMLFMTAGVLISIPFASPQDAYGMRAYAASMPFFALLPALGLTYAAQLLLPAQKEQKRSRIGLLLRRLCDLKPTQQSAAQPAPPTKADIATPLSLLLILLLVVSPVLTRALSAPSAFAHVDCPDGQTPMYTRYSPGSYINVVREDVFLLDWLPNFHQSRYERSIHGLPGELQMRGFLEIEAPATIINGLDLASNQSFWLIANTEQLPSSYGILGICGKWHPSPPLKLYGFFYADTIRLVGE